MEEQKEFQPSVEQPVTEAQTITPNTPNIGVPKIPVEGEMKTDKDVFGEETTNSTKEKQDEVAVEIKTDEVEAPTDYAVEIQDDYKPTAGNKQAKKPKLNFNTKLLKIIDIEYQKMETEDNSGKRIQPVSNEAKTCFWYPISTKFMFGATDGEVYDKENNPTDYYEVYSGLKVFLNKGSDGILRPQNDINFHTAGNNTIANIWRLAMAKMCGAKTYMKKVGVNKSVLAIKPEDENKYNEFEQTIKSEDEIRVWLIGKTVRMEFIKDTFKTKSGKTVEWQKNFVMEIL